MSKIKPLTPQSEQFLLLGKLSAGLFHDLASPLTALTLSLTNLRVQGVLNKQIEKELKRSLNISRSLEKQLTLIKSITAPKKIIQRFSVSREIKNIIKLFQYKCKKSNTTIIFLDNKPIYLLSSKTEFNQLLQLVIYNALESCQGETKIKRKKVVIQTTLKHNLITVSVKDIFSTISITFGNK